MQDKALGFTIEKGAWSHIKSFLFIEGTPTPTSSPQKTYYPKTTFIAFMTFGFEGTPTFSIPDALFSVPGTSGSIIAENWKIEIQTVHN